MAVLKLLRNTTVFANHAAALSALGTLFTSKGDGEVAIATYTSGNTKKTILGVKHLGVVTYFDTEADASAVSTAITNALQALDATVNSTGGTKVSVQVVETDGVITAVNVTENDIASAALLGTTSDSSSANTAFGKIAKEASDRATAITNAINALDANMAAQAGKFIVGVQEINGKIDNVTRAQVVSTDKTVTVGTQTGTNNIDLAVNIDGTSIVKDASTGKLSVANSALVEYVGAQAIDVSAVSGNQKTISLELQSGEKILSQNNNGLKTTLDLKKITTSLPSNVKERWQLVGIGDAQVGTQSIDIYKDSSLLSVKLLHATSSLKPTYSNGTWTDIASQYQTEENLALCFAYEDVNGTTVIEAVPVGDFLRESEFKDGLQVVSGEVSVKVDSTSESFLTVGSQGIKISGIQNAIVAGIQTLDKSDSAVNGQVVTAVSETDGKITVTRANMSGIQLAGFTTALATSGAIAATDTLADALNKLQNAAGAKISSVTGDTYIDADTTNGAVTLGTQVGALTVAKSGSNDTTLTGVSNKLADCGVIGSQVSKFVNDRLGEEIAKLDATAGTQTVASNKHVAVEVKEVDGKVTAVYVAESDIASAADVEANELVVSQALNDLNTNKADKSELTQLASDVLEGVQGVQSIIVSAKSNNSQTISLKLDHVTGTDDNALTQGVQGLYLSSTWDCGEYS